MKRFISILVIILSFGTKVIAATDSAEALYAKAYAQLYKGNEKAAISIFEKGISYYPDCAFLYAGLGDVYRKKGEFAAALDYYTQAQQKKYSVDNYKIDFYSTKLQKNSKDINTALNALILAAKDNDNIILYKNINYIMNDEYLKTILIPELYLNTADDTLNKANQLRNSGQTEAALKAYIAIINANPNNFQAANNAGAMLIELKDYTLAQKYLEQALKLNSNSAIIYNNIGILNFYQKNGQTMDENFKQSLKINPQYIPAINNIQIAKIQSELNYYQSQNIESILDVIKSDVDNYYAARTLAKIYYYKGDFKSANNLLEPLNSTYNFKLYTQKALFAYKAGNSANALNYINKAISLYSDNAIDYEIRGRIYDSMGKYVEAKADFQKAISKNSKLVNIYYYYARSLYKSGNIQEANNMMKDFISLKKGNPQTSFLKILFE